MYKVLAKIFMKNARVPAFDLKKKYFCWGKSSLWLWHQKAKSDLANFHYEYKLWRVIWIKLLFSIPWTQERRSQFSYFTDDFDVLKSEWKNSLFPFVQKKKIKISICAMLTIFSSVVPQLQSFFYCSCMWF